MIFMQLTHFFGLGIDFDAYKMKDMGIQLRRIV